MNKLFFGTILMLGLALSVSACQQPQSKRMESISTSQNALEKQTDQYRVSVRLPNPPLKAQAEAYTLQLHNLKTNQPVEALPEVKVEMPMGNTPMIAPTTLKKTATPGEFQVNTEFTMSGDWTLQVKPVQAAEAITLTLSVQ